MRMGNALDLVNKLFPINISISFCVPVLMNNTIAQDATYDTRDTTVTFGCQEVTEKKAIS